MTRGLNTGGMGTVAPNPCYTPEIAERCMKEIFIPTIKAMNAENRKFKGCLYFGLMLTPDGPKVIEYNCRFGDPETQVVLPLLDTDLVDVFEAVIDEKLSDMDIKWKNECAACVILASGGYPVKYQSGYTISGLNEKGQLDGYLVYHAGTKADADEIKTAGGRVIGVTATAADLKSALDKAYKGVSLIEFKDMHYRKDIGQRALKYIK